MLKCAIIVSFIICLGFMSVFGVFVIFRFKCAKTEQMVVKVAQFRVVRNPRLKDHLDSFRRH